MAKQKAKSDGFVPEDLVENLGSSSFLKFKNGKTKFRCISKPTFGWVWWNEEKKVFRSQLNDEPEDVDPKNPAKRFMAMAVIDREDNEVKILELTQQSVIKKIKALTEDADWGAPYAYDLTVTREGEKLKTKYEVSPSPKKPLEKDVQKKVLERKCCLDRLYEGLNPFELEESDEETEYILK